MVYVQGPQAGEVLQAELLMVDPKLVGNIPVERVSSLETPIRYPIYRKRNEERIEYRFSFRFSIDLSLSYRFSIDFSIFSTDFFTFPREIFSETPCPPRLLGAMRALENPALRRWGAVSTLLPLLAAAWMPLGQPVGCPLVMSIVKLVFS